MNLIFVGNRAPSSVHIPSDISGHIHQVPDFYPLGSDSSETKPTPKIVDEDPANAATDVVDKNSFLSGTKSFFLMKV